MSRFDYDAGQSLFFGEERFTFPLSGSVTSDHRFTAKEQSFSNLHVAVEEQGRKGAKPHVLLLDADGNTVLDVAARASGAYGRLIGHVGAAVETFRWRKQGGKYGEPYMECWIRYATPRSNVPRRYRQLFVDTETTGLDPANDEILQLSIVDGDGRVVLAQTYRPEEHTTWPEAEAIHHIRPAAVRNSPTIRSSLTAIQSILDSAENLYAFNAPFDFAFLGNLGLRCDRERTHDTMREYARKMHGREYIKLTEAAREVGYAYRAHDATADCIATMQVQRKVDDRPLMTKDDFTKLCMRPCGVEDMRRSWVKFWVLLASAVVCAVLMIPVPVLLIPAGVLAYFAWAQARSNELQAQVNEAAGWPSGRDQRYLVRSEPKHAE